MLRRWLLSLAVCSLFACGGESSTEPDKTEEPPPTVVSVEVKPVNPAVNAGATLQFIATAHFSDGTAVTEPAVTWLSETPSVATVTTAGVATGIVEGTTNIRATLNGVSGRTALSVHRVLAGVYVLRSVDAKSLPRSLGSSNCPEQSTNCVVTEYVTGGTLTLRTDGTATLLESRRTDEFRGGSGGGTTSTTRSITYSGALSYSPIDKVNGNGGITIALQPPAPSLFGAVLANDTQIVLSVPSSDGPAYGFVKK